MDSWETRDNDEPSSEYLADKPIASQGQVRSVQCCEYQTFQSSTLLVWRPQLISGRPLCRVERNWENVGTTFNHGHSSTQLHPLHESHEYFESQEKCDCFKNILCTLRTTAVCGRSGCSFHNLIILPLIPGYYPYLEIIRHFLNYCHAAWPGSGLAGAI